MKSGTLTELDALVARLSAFQPAGLPVLSLYLDTRPDHRGRLSVDLFLKNELRARSESFAASSPERESFEQDRARILAQVDQMQPAAGGLALFACAGADGFFEQARLEAPIDRHQLTVADRPHIYPLLRVMDQHPPYAVLVADTNAARLFVFGRGATLRTERVENTRTTRTSMGGWSQMRYQRHVENYHLQHAKEVVAALDAVVRQDGVEQIVLAGDEVIIPLLREQLPPHLTERIVDILRLDITTPERTVLEATMKAVRRHDAKTDAEQVRELLDHYRSGQLGVVGPEATLEAFELGQVDTLLISASPDQVRGTEGSEVADRLVRLARETGAAISFIEDPTLLAGVGGVGALLRFRLQHEGSTGQ